jgi:hypothetical protein
MIKAVIANFCIASRVPQFRIVHPSDIKDLGRVILGGGYRGLHPAILTAHLRPVAYPE